MRTLLALVPAVLLATTAAAQEIPRDALDRVQRRLAESALLVRADAGKETCRERSASVSVLVSESGYLEEFRLESSTGRSALDAQLSEVVALSAPFPEIAGKKATLEVKFACLGR